MKKEVLIAILIGFGLGLVIMYGLYRLRIAMTDKPQAIEEIVKATPSPTAEAEAVIALHSPEDGSIQTETNTTVTGTTLPNSYVVIFVNEEDFITTADESGNFSLDAELELGSNVIVTHVVDNDGNTYTKERTVIVSDIYAQGSEPTSETDTTATDATTEEETE